MMQPPPQPAQRRFLDEQGKQIKQVAGTTLAGHIRALEQSGLSRAEYARHHWLSCHTLTYWHKKLSLSIKEGFLKKHPTHRKYDENQEEI